MLRTPIHKSQPESRQNETEGGRTSYFQNRGDVFYTLYIVFKMGLPSSDKLAHIRNVYIRTLTARRAKIRRKDVFDDRLHRTIDEKKPQSGTDARDDTSHHHEGLDRIFRPQKHLRDTTRNLRRYSYCMDFFDSVFEDAFLRERRHFSSRSFMAQ